VDRELDIVHFLRKQFITEALIQSLTTRRERTLARRNYRIYLPKDQTIEKKPDDLDFTTDETGSNDEQEFDSKFEPRSQIEIHLLTQLKKHDPHKSARKRIDSVPTTPPVHQNTHLRRKQIVTEDPISVEDMLDSTVSKVIEMPSANHSRN
jgi:hypothetical protein